MNNTLLDKSMTVLDELVEANRALMPLNRVKLTAGTELKPTPIHWLWRDWLAKGKFHILAGAPGVGKTTVAMALAATVSCGGRWPTGTLCSKQNVVIYTGEDDPTDTLLPRLLAMGAHPQHIHFVAGTVKNGESQTFDPATDMPMLMAACGRVGSVGLVIVDPCSTAVQGDSHKNTEVRKGLQPLVELAAALDCAVLGITHFSKGGAGGDPTQRVIGSVAFSALARVVLVAAKVRDGNDVNDKRILCRSKSNIGTDTGGFEYGLEQVELEQHKGVFASRVLWGDAIAGNATQLLAEPEIETKTPALDEAIEFLTGLLVNGVTRQVDIKAQAKEADISWATVRNAKGKLGIKSKKVGMDAGWHWSFPNPIFPEGAIEKSKMPIKKTLAPSQNSSIFGQNPTIEFDNVEVF